MGNVFVFSAGVDLGTGIYTLNPMTSHTLVGEGDGDNFGFYVAGAGDFDADGKEDIIVGAPYVDNGKKRRDKRRGKAYVYSGGPGGFQLHSEWMGESQDSWMGRSVDGGFDFDDDGCDDIVVGTNGAVYVYAGCSPPSSPPIFSCEGQSEGNFGISVAGGLSVPGCQGEAILVGDTEAANRAGAVYGYCGNVGGDLKASCTDSGALIFDATGDSPGDATFGYRVAVVGNFNDDPSGYDEIAIGDTMLAEGGDLAGAVYVCDASLGDCAPGPGGGRLVKRLGSEPSARLGSSVSGGDIDGDGVADVVAGGTGGFGDQVGRIRVLLGPGNSPGWDFEREASEINTQFGRSVSATTDFDGEPGADILVGAHFDENGGKLYLFSPNAVCGDGVCGEGEVVLGCPADCN